MTHKLSTGPALINNTLHPLSCDFIFRQKYKNIRQHFKLILICIYIISYQLSEFPLRFIGFYVNVFDRNKYTQLLCNFNSSCDNVSYKKNTSILSYQPAVR